MSNEQIATYLNDHLAGSTAALELIEHLQATHAGTALEPFLMELRADVTADREELQTIMGRLQVAESSVRKAAAWLAGKVTELKLRVDDAGGEGLQLLESLEVLSLGIEGKRGLWKAMAAAARESLVLQVADYERLERRAIEQRGLVEERRLAAAKSALGSEG
jgi:hypothetical protein